MSVTYFSHDRGKLEAAQAVTSAAAVLAAKAIVEGRTLRFAAEPQNRCNRHSRRVAQSHCRQNATVAFAQHGAWGKVA
jgi:hypothetical protein